MSLSQYAVNRIVKLLPPTHFFRLKARLYRLAGVDAHPTARIVSSVNFWGDIDLTIGRDTWVGDDVLILGGGGSRIRLGNEVDVGPRVLITSGGHAIDMTGPHTAGAGTAADITVEDGVWLGAHSTVLGGVTIGRKSVIGAGSLVNQSIPPFVIAVGVPCRPIKRWVAASQTWQELAHDHSPLRVE